jgi:hypothetical protein
MPTLSPQGRTGGPETTNETTELERVGCVYYYEIWKFSSDFNNTQAGFCEFYTRDMGWRISKSHSLDGEIPTILCMERKFGFLSRTKWRTKIVQLFSTILECESFLNPTLQLKLSRIKLLTKSITINSILGIRENFLNNYYHFNYLVI